MQDTAIEQAGPQAEFMEQVYEHEIAAGPDGLGFAAMVNPGFALPGGGRGLGFLVEWQLASMPAFWHALVIAFEGCSCRLASGPATTPCAPISAR